MRVIAGLRLQWCGVTQIQADPTALCDTLGGAMVDYEAEKLQQWLMSNHELRKAKSYNAALAVVFQFCRAV